MARAEAEFWAGPRARHPLFWHSTEEAELKALADAVGEGRAALFDDHYDVAPGIASDAVHYYEELDRGMPFSSVASLVDMYAGFAELKAMLADGRAAHVVSGHDPATLDLFTQVPGPSGATMAVVGRQA